MSKASKILKLYEANFGEVRLDVNDIISLEYKRSNVERLMKNGKDGLIIVSVVHNDFEFVDKYIKNDNDVINAFGDWDSSFASIAKYLQHYILLKNYNISQGLIKLVHMPYISKHISPQILKGLGNIKNKIVSKAKIGKMSFVYHTCAYEDDIEKYDLQGALEMVADENAVKECMKEYKKLFKLALKPNEIKTLNFKQTEYSDSEDEVVYTHIEISGPPDVIKKIETRFPDPYTDYPTTPLELEFKYE